MEKYVLAGYIDVLGEGEGFMLPVFRRAESDGVFLQAMEEADARAITGFVDIGDRNLPVVPVDKELTLSCGDDYVYLFALGARVFCAASPTEIFTALKEEGLTPVKSVSSRMAGNLLRLCDMEIENGAKPPAVRETHRPDFLRAPPEEAGENTSKILQFPGAATAGGGSLLLRAILLHTATTLHDLDDLQGVLDDMADKEPVTVNLGEMHVSVQQRALDMLSGAAYLAGWTLRRLDRDIYHAVPPKTEQ